MSEIKPKKERRFLKTLGRVGEILVEQVLLKLGSSIIKKIGGKKTLPSILFLLASLSLFAQFPNTGNKQRLGFQTTGDGLVWRGALSDTASIQPINNQSAWVILDTINLKFYTFDFTSNVWNLVGGGGSAFTQPVDSLFFNVNVPTNNVDTAKMRWDSDLGTVVLGLNDNVPNEIGFKNFWLVKNQTGSTITKGSLVYANGTVGASGRITVGKFIANGSIDAKYLLGITAHDLTDGEDGYVISFGKIRQVNTDTFAAGSILYPSPTLAGVWTDVEPVAPNIDMPIGFCINSSVNNGTIAIRVASGYKLNELHDVGISSPVDKASLYYSSGLWRDTTPTLLVSDTASMLTPYFRDADTTSLNLTSRFVAKLNLSDTASMLTNYLRTGVAASTYQAKLNGTGFVKANGATISYDNSTYLTTGTASSTYLPLIGGTVSGTINRQEGSNDGSASTFYYNILNYFAKRDNNKGNQTAQITFTDRPGTATFENNVRTSDIYLMTAKNFSGGQLGQYLDTTLSVVANQDGGRIGISKLNPAYKLDVNGTLGVTGVTTLSAPLTVNSSAVFNEGSADADFRVESDGNANMLFVDGTNNRVGIGTASPTKTLDVNGEVRINTVTATPTSLLGKDGSNVVGNVRLTPPLSLAGDSLNLETVPITKGGTGAESASVARTTLGVGYVFLSTATGGTVLLSSNRAYLVITGTGSTTTIDLSTATSGRQYMIKNLSNASVISDASNIIPLDGGAAGTAILSAGNVTPQWVTLVADGTNWHVMQRN